jgi:pyruvate carboxylase subunit B
MKYFVEIEGRTFEVEIGPDGVRLDGRPVEADLQRNSDSRLCHLVLDGCSHTVAARRRDGVGEWEIEIGGRRHRVLALDERRRAVREVAGVGAGARGPIEVKAPMPGLIVKVEVGSDQEVEKGQGLVVIEAMKMENELKAPAPGRVAEVRAEPGQAVEKGETLLVIAPAEG